MWEVRRTKTVNGFLTELKRRNVIRMAGLYLVGAWLLVQVAGTVLPVFGSRLDSYAVRHDSSFAAFLWDQCFDPLRNYPRFKAALAKLGLPYTPPAGTEL